MSLLRASRAGVLYFDLRRFPAGFSFMGGRLEQAGQNSCRAAEVRLSQNVVGVAFE